MNQQKRNRILIMVIFAMSIIPFMIAWGLKENPQLLPQTGVNNGKLIAPPILTAQSDYTGFDPFSANNLGELSGHWLIANLLPNANCNDICLQALYKSKQLQLMLNKELTRTRRIAIILKPVNPEQVSSWWQDDPRLIRIRPSSAFSEKLQAIHNDASDGTLLLIDPLGNVMMQYKAGFDPYKVKNDLMHLLKISQIG
ncbi:MAG: hypothetical protein CTY34_01165 [Methylobacter sp.]|nr:MAG: hypothetical protein CTY34_01165 [Methylobacter sp.]PPD22973.1 MAG: hypothetical protein CTY24_05980 [Methylobacter sp.]PPD37414.1 MAG: hypothetical protein CTY18_00360 [Methylomonas sp.]